MTALSPPNLFHWCRETKKLILSFQDLSFIHICREHNWIADNLSKVALSYPQGKGSFMEYFKNHLVSHDTFQLFWAWWGDYTLLFILCLDIQGVITFRMLIKAFWHSVDVAEETVLSLWWDIFFMGILIFTVMPFPLAVLLRCHLDMLLQLL